jgi:ribosome maturation factor RimP
MAWAGHEAKVETREPIGGRRRFRGLLQGLSEGPQGDVVHLEVPADQGGPEVDLPLGAIQEARLVLTDELIRDTLRRTKKAMAGKEAAADAPEDAPAQGAADEAKT